MNLKNRDFLKLEDYSSEEIQYLIDLGLYLKEHRFDKETFSLLERKSLGMIFEKASTRTRVAFEVGMHELGGHALLLSKNDLQLGRGESIEDTAKVLSRYLSGILIRTFSQEVVEEFAYYADVPVINGLTDLTHPTQVIADLITIKEHKGKLGGLKLVYVGDGNNVAHSLMEGCLKMDMSVSIVSPDVFRPNARMINRAKSLSEKHLGTFTLTESLEEGLKDADVVYTDTWCSMGQEQDKLEKVSLLKSFQVNEDVLDLAKNDVIFMHCLPAYRDFEVTKAVIDGPNSVVFDEAENRLHAHKAIMAAIL